MNNPCVVDRKSVSEINFWIFDCLWTNSKKKNETNLTYEIWHCVRYTKMQWTGWVDQASLFSAYRKNGFGWNKYYKCTHCYT